MDLFWALFFYSFFFSSSIVSCDTQTFIVQVQNDLKPSEFSDVEDWYSSTLKSIGSKPLSRQNPTSDFIHVYKTVFHGFSARLSLQQAEELKNRPEILAVYPNRVRKLHITRTPQFLRLSGPAISNGLLKDSDYGSNVIIGMLDTGIWPERQNFEDEGLNPIPSHWKGECTEGENFTKTLCNKKLIGARYFTDGYVGSIGKNDLPDIKSARDTIGHGTHTASTAAGRPLANSSFLGFARGLAAGIAPKARIAVYKVCWRNDCAESDILAGLDKAVEDGVDVISLSLGSSSALPYNLDPIAIGAFGAMEKGIVVSASAGNDGFRQSSVTNVAPWLITVGASTIDRKFPADLVFEDGRVITGSSLYDKNWPEGKYLPLIYAGNASTKFGSSANYCLPNTLDVESVRGKIVVCDRGHMILAEKGLVVKEAGGAGVVIANLATDGEGLIADAHLFPGLAITVSAGNTLRDYISSSENPRATMVFRGTKMNVTPAPVVAAFSSRGPNPLSRYILKPDVIAPGVDILAAWPDGIPPTDLSVDTRRTEFNIISGTSMSCPHVSGVAALLKGAHPNWTPAMIRSALMTTAYTHGQDGKLLVDEADYNTSNPWGMGAGHVDPEKAADPGLVYDLTVDDYLDFLCASNISDRDIKAISRRTVNCSRTTHRNPWDLNYPAISVDFDVSEPFNSEVSATRTLTHVSDGASTYQVSVTNPKGASVKVGPGKMVFTENGAKMSYVVQISAEKVEVPRGYSKSEFGQVTWTDGKHYVTSPIVVTWYES